jgi:3-oxoacyl-[acyl-carrier-protein] synthase-3
VVGTDAGEHGVLAASHYVDGARPHTLIASVPGRPWYDAGRAMLHLADPAGMADILLRTVDLSTEGIQAALDRAGLAPGDVELFCMHQGMPWLRELVQERAGLTGAAAIDTFTRTGHLFAAFVPSTLVAAEQEGILRDGAVVVISGGGNGMTYGATVLRWGRG